MIEKPDREKTNSHYLYMGKVLSGFPFCLLNSCFMVDQACFYWVNMLKALEGVQKREQTMNAAAEGFNISIQYWQQFLAAIPKDALRDPNLEVVFFKQLKPLFTTEINYYKLLYCGFMFLPQDAGHQGLYWSSELARMNKFMSRHKVFYDYYLRGAKDRDQVYFTRHNCGVERFLVEKYETYDQEVPYDLLLSLLLAMSRYEIFIGERLAVADRAGH